jgi:LmbE family N-acetylglucosaminyl deacetylase
MKKFYILFLAICLQLTAFAQSPQTWSSADMYLAMRKLHVLGSVLYIAAHPDDENTRLIAYLAKDKMYRTGYLSLTRGDGGQNLIGDEQGIELGLIRTQELLAARRVDGGEQFFTRAFDFGYSKTPDETFTKWDREKILSDVVWVIRRFQPDVIITRFPTTGEGGHGHHTASAILANEAFAAAADPNRFPEQLGLVQTWQVKRVLWNTFNFGGNNTTSADQFKVDVGGFNPLLGKGYGEIAAISRSNHKSQGFGSAAGRGEQFEFFKTTKGDQPVTDLMDGVELSWKRVPGGEAVAAMIDKLIASFDMLHPEKSVGGLAELYKAILDMPQSYWRDQKLKEVYELIPQCAGLYMEATTTVPFAVQTDSVKINYLVNNRLGADIELSKVIGVGFDTVFARKIEKNKNIGFSKTVFVPSSKEITQPYWLEHKMEEGYYNVNNQWKIGQPDVDPAYNVAVQLKINGGYINYLFPVKYKFTDPVKGEIYQPLFVIPAATMTISPQKLLFRKGLAEEKKIYVQLNPNTNSSASVDVFLRGLGEVLKKKESEKLAKYQNKTYEFSVAQAAATTESKVTLYGTADIPKGNDTLNAYLSLRAINYDHIPAIKYVYGDAATKLTIDLKTYNKRIGYITGAGDKVPEALEEMGYEVTLLTDKELTRNNLQQFDAIITGVRAYNTNDWMNNHYNKLMKYVEDGGNLIVQYNTSNNIGPVKAKISPYNFNISRTRITDENAPVVFLKPGHQVLNFPNKITANDFKGWIQERSIYHAADWDKEKFETILSMNDPGEKSEEGSLIIAKHGKGYFTYTGLVFFRELPAGVPGAYRLLANIIALNKKKAF